MTIVKIAFIIVNASVNAVIIKKLSLGAVNAWLTC